MGMDYINLLGSIASIIALGYIVWNIIKKRQISFFTLYMLGLVLFQIISIGWALWTGKKVNAVIDIGILLFQLFCWYLYYILDRQQEMLNSVVEILKSQSKILDAHRKDINNLYDVIKEILLIMEQSKDLSQEGFQKTVDILQEVVISLESKIDINDEQLIEKMTKLQKKIGKKKSK